MNRTAVAVLLLNLMLCTRGIAGWIADGAPADTTSGAESDPVWGAASNSVTGGAVAGTAAYVWGNHGTNGYPRSVSVYNASGVLVESYVATYIPRTVWTNWAANYRIHFGPGTYTFQREDGLQHGFKTGISLSGSGIGATYVRGIYGADHSNTLFLSSLSLPEGINAEAGASLYFYDCQISGLSDPAIWLEGWQEWRGDTPGSVTFDKCYLSNAGIRVMDPYSGVIPVYVRYSDIDTNSWGVAEKADLRLLQFNYMDTPSLEASLAGSFLLQHPAGADTCVQINSNGVFGASSNLVFAPGSSVTMTNVVTNAVVTGHLMSIAHYTMDDNAADTVVLDSAGTNHGVSTENTDSTHTNGIVNGAFVFDGAQYVSASDAGLPTGSSPFSVSMWLYTTDNSDFQTWAFSMGDGQGGHGLYIYFTPYMGYRVIVGNGQAQFNSATSLTPFTWYLLTVTSDGTDTHLYLNGQLDEEGSLSSTYINPYGTAYIGYAYWPALAFKGGIDDVRIYDVALSANDVSFLFNGGAGTEEEIPRAAVYPHAPMAWFKFDDSAADSTGNYTGTWVGVESYDAGRFGNAMTNDYTKCVFISDVATFQQSTSFSYSAWFSTTGAFSTIMGTCDFGSMSGTMLGLGWLFGGGDIYFFAGQNSTVTPYQGGNLNDGALHHAVAVYDVENTQIRLYVDGTLAASNVLTDVINLNSNPLTIGGINGTGTGFDGVIDEALVFGYALNDSQVASLYAGDEINGTPFWTQVVKPPDPVAWYKFDDNADSTDILDSSTNAQTGTAQQNTDALSTAGVFSNGLTFSGNSDWIDLGTGPIIPQDGSAFTVSWWQMVNLDNCTNGCEMIADFVWNGGGAGGCALMYFGTEGARGFQMGFRYAGDVQWTIDDSITNRWVMMTAVYKGPSMTSTSIDLYMDGVLYEVGKSDSMIGASQGDDNFIGRSNSLQDTNPYPYGGLMDEFLIFNYALSSNQVASLYAGNEISGTPFWEHGGVETITTNVTSTTTPPALIVNGGITADRISIGSEYALPETRGVTGQILVIPAGSSSPVWTNSFIDNSSGANWLTTVPETISEAVNRMAAVISGGGMTPIP